MTVERDQALEDIFSEASGRPRSAGDAAALAVEGLNGLIEGLKAGHELGDEYGTETRHAVDALIHNAAMRLGRDALGGMRGMVISETVEQSTVLPRAQDETFRPLDDSWQRGGSPYDDLVDVAEKQRKTLQKLAEQPNQLYRRLQETVSLAADLGGWTAWTCL